MKRTSSPSPSCSTQSSTPFAVIVGMDGGTLERRAPLCPGTRALERGADPQRLVVAIASGDDLEPEREPVVAPAGGDAEGRALAHEVELRGHVEAVVEAV